MAKTGETKLMASNEKRASGEALRLTKYEVELARGASHVASTIYEESLLAAVQETIQGFEASYGREDLQIFASALLERLKLRGNALAAGVLDEFIRSGRLPEKISGGTSKPESARKSEARRRNGMSALSANRRRVA